MINKICDHHILAGPTGYIARAEWAERKLKLGHRQKKCKICKHWFFPEEMGNSK